jgi:hypothetical protein
MSQAKRTSKGKRPSKAVSVLGITGASLAASATGSIAAIPLADIPSQNTIPFQNFLGEEEISDVSLATFHLFDKNELGALSSGIQLARGGCGCGHGGCGGCGGRGCGGRAFGGGFRGCGVGFRGCFRGCGRGCGCGWGGCGGCYGWGWGWGYGGYCLSWGGCYPYC